MRKTISISAVLMILLAITGVTYAMWSKTLYITGNVHTDTVSGKWIWFLNSDPNGTYSPDWIYNGLTATRGTKDVGSTNVSGLGTDTLKIMLNNTYPSYFNDIETEYINTGSVPVIIKNITVIPTPIGSWNLASPYWNSTNGPVWVSPGDGIGSQLDPYSWAGEVKSQSFKIHVTQAAAQNATYTFIVKYVLVQWNEYP
jgi:hypothetical protein